MDPWLIFLASSIIFGGACAIIAANKNRDPLGWFALGFFFSLVGLIVIAALSPATQASSDHDSRSRRKGAKTSSQTLKIPSGPGLGEPLMAAARARGSRIGRRPAMTDDQRLEARLALADGSATVEVIAERHGIHPRTLLRTLKVDDRRQDVAV